MTSASLNLHLLVVLLAPPNERPTPPSDEPVPVQSVTEPADPAEPAERPDPTSAPAEQTPLPALEPEGSGATDGEAPTAEHPDATSDATSALDAEQEPLAGPLLPPESKSPPVASPSKASREDAVRAKIKRWRTQAGLAFGLSGVGWLATGISQGVRYKLLRDSSVDCVGTEDAQLQCLDDAYATNIEIGYYTIPMIVIGVGGMAGGASLLGNAAASRDAELRGSIDDKTGAKVAGGLLIGASSIALVAGNIVLFRRQLRCEDVSCHTRHQTKRFIMNDVSGMVLGVGAALLGHALTYEKQGGALMKLAITPAAGRDFSGLVLSGHL